MIDDTYLTTEEILQYLHINLRTVYRLVKAGKLPAFRVGRQWRFRRSDIDSFLARNVRVASIAPHVPRTTAPGSVHGLARVVVVDDDPAVRDILSRALSGSFHVETAPDGRTALERLRTSPHELLIVDLRLPDLDGLSLIREARRTQQDLQVVVITGFPSESAAIAAINLGVNGYLTKPFGPREVVAVANRALQRSA